MNPKMVSRSAMALTLFGALSLAGCSFSLLSRSTPPTERRYFSPELTSAEITSTNSPRDGAPRVRLGRITPSSNLRGRIVYRATPHELGEYEDLRWSDAPEAYVRRALSHALFVEHGAQAASSGSIPVLDIELVAFEEVRRPHGAAGAVEMTYTLTDGSATILVGRTRIEREATAATIDAVVVAISAALDAATKEVARATMAALTPK